MRVTTISRALVLVVVAGYAPLVIAQDETIDAPSSTPITISLPENVELRILVEYVSQQLKLNILYDQSLGSQKLTLPDQKLLIVTDYAGNLQRLSPGSAW